MMENHDLGPVQGGKPVVDNDDWKTRLPSGARERIVNKIMDTLKKHLPFAGEEGLHELRLIAARFEEKIYIAATSQVDYLRRISLKMLTMETKAMDTVPNSLPTYPVSTSNGTSYPEP